MSRRVWTTVVVTTATLLLASTALSAWPMVAGMLEQVRNLPWTVVVLALVSCILWLVALGKLYRTWVVRRNLVRVLARFGTPTSVIASTAQLSQDGVALLTGTSSGNHVPLQREVFSGTGNQFTPFQTLRPATDSLATSTLAET